MVRTLRFLSWEGGFPGTFFQVVVSSSVQGRVAELTTVTHRSVTLSGVMRSGVGWTRQIAGEDPQNGCPDLCRLPCLTHPKKRGTKGRRRAPNGTSAAAAVITHETRKGNFGPLKKSLVFDLDFSMLPPNPDVDRDGNHGDPDSAEEPELSCSVEELVTPLLGTQSGFYSICQVLHSFVQINTVFQSTEVGGTVASEESWVGISDHSLGSGQRYGLPLGRHAGSACPPRQSAVPIQAFEGGRVGRE